MLNAELKSMNSILTYESFLSRCVRAGWTAVAMASLVERLDLYANCSLSQQIRILHKTNKKNIFSELLAFWKAC